MKKGIILFTIAFIGGLLGAFVMTQLTKSNGDFTIDYTSNQAAHLANFSNTNIKSILPEDFVEASSKSTSSVVFIKTRSHSGYGDNPFDWFFGRRSTESVSSGSGVIFTADGYIVTNHHVVDNAETIEVVHKKASYPAQLIGVDPSSDLAVLKIDRSNLPNIVLGSSRTLQVGEWVLAVGNPFNLTSTVTAGIVSAKGRNLNILTHQFPIESFIQTDAAINPGNSGGALVNKEGELVGINTAILSRTGSYAGYGFAIPVDIVKKVVTDIIKYGEVQKAFIGLEVIDIDAETVKSMNLNAISGVQVSRMQSHSMADKKGLQVGDVILKIDEDNIHSKSIFDEIIAYHSPGDQIQITYARNGKINNIKLTLTNREGTTSFLKRNIYKSSILDADLERISQVEKNKLNLKEGVKIIRSGKGFIRRLGISEGFIITKINEERIQTPEQLERVLQDVSGRIIVEGVNERGERGYYSYSIY